MESLDDLAEVDNWREWEKDSLTWVDFLFSTQCPVDIDTRDVSQRHWRGYVIFRVSAQQHMRGEQSR